MNIKLSEALPNLRLISLVFGIKLNTTRGFKLAKTILENIYTKELI
jgi:hypothetical protein